MDRKCGVSAPFVFVASVLQERRHPCHVRGASKCHSLSGARFLMAKLPRRDFVGLLTGAVAWPVQPSRMTAADPPLGIKAATLSRWPGDYASSFVHHRDGRLMIFLHDWTVAHSSDGGHTWSLPQPVQVADKDQLRGAGDASLTADVRAVIRLSSGKLGLLSTFHNHYR